MQSFGKWGALCLVLIVQATAEGVHRAHSNREGTTWGRACEKSYGTVRDAVARYPVQRVPALQNWESFDKCRTPASDVQLPLAVPKRRL